MNDSPTYVFAGTSMGGSMVMECQDCGTLLREPMQAKHTVFHLDLARLVKAQEDTPTETQS